MANQEHLAILAKGVETWNAWRRANRGINPDFIGADLGGADLRAADLSDADLSDADLGRASLICAELSGAVLTCADLSEVNLGGADLSHADLSEAHLGGADVSAADLSGAVLSRAKMHFTTLGDTDLSTVKGLETVIHLGPSTIGIDTLYRSQGKIPDSFLRGAGVPENLITYMKSLTGAAFDFSSCFISHSSKDQDFAERLHADLQAKGVRCWFAPEDLKIGDRFRRSEERRVRVYDKVMIVLSDASVKSRWVEREVNAAMEREGRENRQVLFPIRIDEAVMEAPQPWAADVRRTRHIGNFCDWQQHPAYRTAFDRLLRDLKAGV